MAQGIPPVEAALTILMVKIIADRKKTQKKMKTAAVAGSLALAGCPVVASIQLNYWCSSAAILSHTIQVTQDNDAAHGLPGSRAGQRRPSEAALELFTEFLWLKPDYAEARRNSAKTPAVRGTDEAHVSVAADVTRL